VALITNNENLRLKRMAELVSGRKSVLDIGSADMPNSYLDNPEVIALDLEKHDSPPNDRMPASILPCST